MGLYFSLLKFFLQIFFLHGVKQVPLAHSNKGFV
jgi:hypothetical protein